MKKATMKKMAGVCVFALCASALTVAQEVSKPFSITVDAAVDALYIRGFFDDYAENNPAGPYKYQGDGHIKSFQSSAFDDALLGRVTFAYAGERLGGKLMVKADSASVLGDWEVWLKYAGLRILSGNTAQRGQIRQFANFDDFLKNQHSNVGIMMPKWKVNPAGTSGNAIDVTKEFPWGYDSVNTSFGYAELLGIDTADLFTPAGSTARQSLGFALDYTVKPLTLSASIGGLFSDLTYPFQSAWQQTQAVNSRTNQADMEHSPAEIAGLNFGFRAEGAKIAELLTVALVYKYADSWYSKPESAATPTAEEYLIDEKKQNHTFGVYGTVTPIDGLGITAGYSGQLQFYTNSKYEKTKVDSTGVPSFVWDEHDLSGFKEVIYPFYSGIDLRASYSGLELLGQRITLTLNNNVSFARLNGTEKGASHEMYIRNWAYQGELNTKRVGVDMESCEETYFGLYNAFAAEYQLNKSFLINFQAANKLAFFNLKWEGDPLQSVNENLGLYAGVVSAIYEKGGVKGSLRGGFALRFHSYTYQQASVSAGNPVYKAGFYDFGIPVGLKIEF